MFQFLSTMFVASLAAVAIRYSIGSSGLGLLGVNVFGSLIAGVLGGLKLFDNPWVTAGIVGFCGCLTTFSGYALENVKLFEQGEIFKVATNFFLHNALCLLVCYVGYLLGHSYSVH